MRLSRIFLAQILYLTMGVDNLEWWRMQADHEELLHCTPGGWKDDTCESVLPKEWDNSLKTQPSWRETSLSWQSTEPRCSIGLKKNFGRWFSLQVSPIYEHSMSNIAPKHRSNCSKKGVSGSYLPVITLLLEPRLTKQLRALLLDSSKVLFCTDP